MEKLWRKEVTPDVLNAALGLLLFLSPFVFRSFGDSAASWNAWLSGILIVILAITALVQYAEWQHWLTLMMVGVWVTLSPWLGKSGRNASSSSRGHSGCCSVGGPSMGCVRRNATKTVRSLIQAMVH